MSRGFFSVRVGIVSILCVHESFCWSNKSHTYIYHVDFLELEMLSHIALFLCGFIIAILLFTGLAIIIATLLQEEILLDLGIIRIRIQSRG